MIVVEPAIIAVFWHLHPIYDNHFLRLSICPQCPLSFIQFHLHLKPLRFLENINTILAVCPASSSAILSCCCRIRARASSARSAVQSVAEYSHTSQCFGYKCRQHSSPFHTFSNCSITDQPPCAFLPTGSPFCNLRILGVQEGFSNHPHTPLARHTQCN